MHTSWANILQGRPVLLCSSLAKGLTQVIWGEGVGQTCNTPYLNVKDVPLPLNPNTHTKGTVARPRKRLSPGSGKDHLTTIPLQIETARWTLGTRDKAPCFPSEASWRLPGDSTARPAGVPKQAKASPPHHEPLSRRKPDPPVCGRGRRARASVWRQLARVVSPRLSLQRFEVSGLGYLSAGEFCGGCCLGVGISNCVLCHPEPERTRGCANRDAAAKS